MHLLYVLNRKLPVKMVHKWQVSFGLISIVHEIIHRIGQTVVLYNKRYLIVYLINKVASSYIAYLSTALINRIFYGLYNNSLQTCELLLTMVQNDKLIAPHSR